MLTALPMRPTLVSPKTDPAVASLWASGRWCEFIVPVGQGDQHIIIAGLYGIPGASSDSLKRKLNVQLCSLALTRSLMHDNTPYYICTDLSADPAKTIPIQLLASKGKIFDTYKHWAGDDYEPSPTYRNGTVMQQMLITVKNTTLIDTVLTNYVASHTITGAQYDWKKFHGLDHVALKTSTSIHRLQQKIIKQQQPVHIHVPENHPSKIKQRETVKNQMSDAFTKAWYADYENDFTKAIDNNKLEAADNIWHLACENTLGSILHAQQLNQIGNQRPVRGTTLPAHEVSHAIPFNAKQGEATTNATATRQQHSGRLREIKARMQRWCCSTDPIAQQKQEAKPIYI